MKRTALSKPPAELALAAFAGPASPAAIITAQPDDVTCARSQETASLYVLSDGRSLTARPAVCFTQTAGASQ